MIFIGIDPGQSGGIAVAKLSGDALLLQHWQGFANMTQQDTMELIRRPVWQNLPLHATLEKVHSMPKQGVASSFKFGWHAGFLEGCLVALGIPHILVSPQSWQKTMDCLSRGDKNVTKRAAQRLFPVTGKPITHATADAILLACYGWKLYLKERSIGLRPSGGVSALAPRASESPPRPSLEDGPAPF